MALSTDTSRTRAAGLFERFERSLPGANTRTTTLELLGQAAAWAATDSTGEAA
jgi:hypothetical protein